MIYSDFRVFLEDTDAGKIMYHARYLCFLERARTLLFEQIGVDHAKMIEAQTGNFVVANLEISYKLPAVLADTLRVVTRIDSIGGSSVHLSNIIYRVSKDVLQNSGAIFENCDILTTAKVVLVLINPLTGSPIRLPTPIKDLLIKEQKDPQ